MQRNQTAVAPALRALLENLFDYAGTFPPASLDTQTALNNYSQYANHPYAWMLRYMVVSAADVAAAPAAFDGKLSVLAESDVDRAGAIESKGLVQASGKAVYWEVATNNLHELDRVKDSGCFAKIRTGAVSAQGIPSVADVAKFIVACAERRLAFKATAGLHHPIRAEYALSYVPDAPRAVMHGFLNVMVAAAFAWDGERDIAPILDETRASAFEFGNELKWNGKSLSAEQIKDARTNFMHAIGTCSFEEPVSELQALKLLI